MLRALPGGRAQEQEEAAADKLALLMALEKKALWLSTWMIHQANHLRPSRDGLKVGGHQASSASVATLMTAFYLDVMRPQDRIAVKPHAAPLFHALQYLLGNQSRDKLERFRGLGGAQAYPSRSKDGDIVDFSTGSVGLGVGVTLFAALVQDYLRLKRLVPSDTPPGRMIALAGDAELDEGNIFEALLEGWKHDIRNLWWVIDYNRQSLDAVVSDRLFGRIDALFEMFGWRVVTLKYGRLLQAAFARPDGDKQREGIDACPNSRYSALVYKGGEGWREHLRRDLNRYPGIRMILEEHDDAALGRLMTNLAGHDMGSDLDARIVTTSPDVTVSTNLGAWVNRRGIFDRTERADIFREEKVVSAQRWAMAPQGQHIELGIAENNLFLTLAALGMAGPLFGTRLLPIGTLYDPFIKRGLDALNYALYQDSRFILVATPSGITLAPEGGAHQSIAEPMIGMAQDGLAAFEPAFVDELAAILAFALDYIQKDGGDAASERNWLRDETGGSIY